MKRLLYSPLLLAILMLGACDGGVAIQGDTDDAVVDGLESGAKGVVKESVSYVYPAYFDESFPEFTDFVVPCLGGLVRGEGVLMVEGTKLNTPGGLLVMNWTVNYDESELWFDYIDAVGGARINPGPDHDWVMVKGSQNGHDVAEVDDWNDEISLSSGPAMHQFSMHEWYYNAATGETQTLIYPSVFFYEGWDGSDLQITRYMAHGFCPGKAGTN